MFPKLPFPLTILCMCRVRFPLPQTDKHAFGLCQTVAAVGGTTPPCCPRSELCCDPNAASSNSLVGPIATTLGIDISSVCGLVALAQGCSPIVIGGPNCVNVKVNCGQAQGGLIAFYCVVI
ncbi:hypothetical protein C8R45DRAFT_928437 [Mycena sanguinolenta]|nr:hypothetical protein C8R45DRAFT_928437 [Mycena sanguinolenta]